MKRLIIMAVLMGCMLPVAAQTRTKSVSPSDFSGVSVSSYFEVEITKGNRPRVELEFSPELEEYIVCKVTGGVLSIGLDSKNMPRNLKNNYDRNKYILRAKVTAPDLEKLSASGATKVNVLDSFSPKSFKGDFSGASSVKVSEIKTGSASIDCSGASKLTIAGKVSGTADYDISGASKVELNQDIDKLDIEVSGASNVKLSGNYTKINIDQSGASKVEIAGNADELELELSGASNFNGDNLSAKSGEVDASGASNAYMNVSKRLKVEISGSSSVRYADHSGLDLIIESMSKGSSLRKR